MGNNKCNDWKTLVQNMHSAGNNYYQMAAALKRFFPELTERQRYDKARKLVIRHIEPGRNVYNTRKTNDEPLWRNEQKIRNDGSIIIKALSGTPVSPEKMMKDRGLNPNEWAIETCNIKDFSKTRAGKVMPSYETHLVIRPKTIFDITCNELSAIVQASNKVFNKTSPRIAPATKSGGKVGEINIADPHIGLVSLMSEVGKEYYNLEIAFARIQKCMSKVLKRLVDEDVDRIRLVTLGDILHVDNAQNTTTNGTFQNIDGTIHGIIPQASKFMKVIIDSLLTLEKPVEYVYIEGNHDRVLGYTVALLIQEAYSKNPLFTCDVDAKPIKIRVDGCFVNAYHHGDANVKNLSDTPTVKVDELADNLSQDNRFAGMKKFVKVGHLHHEEDKMRGSTTICYQPTICGHSHWEYGQAYGDNVPGIKCYFYDNKTLDKSECFVSAI